jgi:hypothetical protein
MRLSTAYAVNCTSLDPCTMPDRKATHAAKSPDPIFNGASIMINCFYRIRRTKLFLVTNAQQVHPRKAVLLACFICPSIKLQGENILIKSHDDLPVLLPNLNPTFWPYRALSKSCSFPQHALTS